MSQDIESIESFEFCVTRDNINELYDLADEIMTNNYSKEHSTFIKLSGLIETYRDKLTVDASDFIRLNPTKKDDYKEDLRELINEIADICTVIKSHFNKVENNKK
jgi:hypothetical protein